MPQVAAAAIMAGVAAHEANAARQAQKPYINAITGAANTEAGTAKDLAPYAKGFAQRAQEAYDPAAAMYKAQAAGGQPLLNTIGPELSQIGQKYGSVYGTIRNMQPRTGGNANDMLFRAGDEQQALVAGKRESAAAKLVDMSRVASAASGDFAGGGARAAGTGITGLDSALSGTRNIAADRSNALSQFQLTPDQMNGMARWANGKRGTGAGGGDFSGMPDSSTPPAGANVPTPGWT